MDILKPDTMVYPREGVQATPVHHSGSQRSDAEHALSKKKKRKKQVKGRFNAAAETRKTFRGGDKQEREQGKNTHVDISDDDYGKAATPARAGVGHKPARIAIPSAEMFLRTIPPSPTKLSRDGPPEVFVYDSLKDYKIARALFSTGYSSTGSPLPEDANIKATLRWNQVMSCITSAPISCEVLPMKGVSVKIIRPARNGLEARSCVIHKPHSRNPRCEREVLENFASAFKQAFGWEKDGFVLGSRIDLEDQSMEMPEEGEDEGKDKDGDPTLDIDSI